MGEKYNWDLTEREGQEIEEAEEKVGNKWQEEYSFAHSRMKWLFSKNEVTPFIYKIPPHEIQRTFPRWPGWPQVICTGVLKEVQLLGLGCSGISNGLISHSSSGGPSDFLMITRVGVLPVCDWLYHPKKTHWLLEVFPLFISQELHFVIRAIKSHAWARHSCKTDRNPDTRGNRPSEVIKREVIFASNLTLSRKCPSISRSMIC